MIEKNLNFLSTRMGFNIALRHFKFVNNLVNECKKKKNLADLINAALDNNLLKEFQFKSILNILLLEKFGYHVESFNIKIIQKKTLSDIAEQIKDWNLLDFVIAYHHPQLGQVLINPKNSISWEILAGGLKENELAVLYVGYFGMDFDIELAKKCVKSIIALIQGEKINDAKLFKSDSSSYTKKVVQQKDITKAEPKISGQRSTIKRLSPQYGVVVSNELFHNGNVEAWKKIIESYETKYPDIEVLVFYDNEEIRDLNTLFQWGKVKSGTEIIFRLLGTEIKDASKLRRYLFQGASHLFEAFLKGAPGQILPLF
ncbi:MAG: hypothetical protein KAT05_07430 [Spirochaetes bacterium]|nr:hypothetical protein [Spirochaetota bacterium]